MTRTRWPLLLTALATWGVAGLHGGIEQRSPQPIRSDRLEVRLVAPGINTLPGGAVVIEQAWHIASPDSGFGGFSALMVRADGSMRLLGDTGMVVPPMNEEALARAMLEMIAMDGDERHLLGAAARERVQTRFTLGRMAAGFRKVWDEVITGEKQQCVD